MPQRPKTPTGARQPGAADDNEYKVGDQVLVWESGKTDWTDGKVLNTEGSSDGAHSCLVQYGPRNNTDTFKWENMRLKHRAKRG